MTEFDSELLTWDLPQVQWLRLHLPMQGGSSSITGWGAKIPHASWPKKQNRKQKKNIVTNLIMTLKMVHIKKKKKERKKDKERKKNLLMQKIKYPHEFSIQL